MANKLEKISSTELKNAGIDAEEVKRDYNALPISNFEICQGRTPDRQSKNEFEYHFSLFLSFKKDVDLQKLEKLLNIHATKITPLKDSVGKIKTAKMWFKTRNFKNANCHLTFEKFLISLYDSLKNIKTILEEFQGELWIDIVFTKSSSAPSICYTKNAIKYLSLYNANSCVDFI